MGWEDGKDYIRCLNVVSGKTRWDASYSAPQYGRYAKGDQGLYGGVTSTPELCTETGLLFTLGNDGQLACWDVKQKGEQVWGFNLYDRFHVQQRPKIGRSSLRDYGYTSSPLVHDDWLIVEVGGDAGTLIGFDKRTGDVAWTSELSDPAGHTAGPVPVWVDGKPCVAILTLHHLAVVQLDEPNCGKTLATYPWQTVMAQNVASPVVVDSRLLATSGYSQAAMRLLEVKAGELQVVWESSEYSKVCSPVVYGDYVYFVNQSPICLDLQSGAVVWKGRGGLGDAGSCIATKDARLIFWGGRGELILAETANESTSAFKELTSKRVFHATDAWPHLALSDGRLFLKDGAGNLHAYQLGKP